MSVITKERRFGIIGEKFYGNEMKIALSCRSILLEKSLRKFLDTYLVPDHDAELLISDHPIRSRKPVLRIGTDKDADLGKPFSRSRLMMKIEEKLQANRTKEAIRHFAVEEESLEEQVERAVQRFTKELIEIFKEHYEKKK
ncbi:JHP0747 family [Hydrogenimonas sp.]|nr:JHP0747 family [Hydrogenimonas sp.]